MLTLFILLAAVLYAVGWLLFALAIYRTARRHEQLTPSKGDRSGDQDAGRSGWL